MFASFETRAAAVSAEVHRFAGKPDALAFILALLEKEGVSPAEGAHAVWAPGTFLDGFDRERIAADAGVRFQVTRELAASAKVGLSQAALGIADTGTLVTIATAVVERLVSALPPIHVAILPTSAIVADLAAALRRVSPKEHAYLSLITGPSRTADIERVLTIGVHGPGRLIIVCVDDLEASLIAE